MGEGGSGIIDPPTGWGIRLSDLFVKVQAPPTTNSSSPEKRFAFLDGLDV
jgi:hypothetical protein